MKHVVMSALAITLLTGTSALAQEGMLGRLVRESAERSSAPAQSAPPQSAPPQRQQQAAPPPQPRVERSGDTFGGRSREDATPRGERQPSPAARPQGLGAIVQQGAQQRAQGDRQGTWRPGAPQSQQRPAGQTPSQRGQDGRQYEGDRYRDRDGQYDRRDGGPLAEVVREGIRRNNGAPGWNGDRGPQGRPPVVRPEDRRDRDRDRPRYDERRYPRYVTPRQRYYWGGPSYRPPVGFYSFRWQWGQTLPWNWYTPNYYLNDWWSYGLPRPPIGYEWIRLGDDAVLVDVFTGRIRQVVYNLFW